jgi:hypothetical protein
VSDKTEHPQDIEDNNKDKHLPVRSLAQTVHADDPDGLDRYGKQGMYNYFQDFLLAYFPGSLYFYVLAI